MSHLPLVNDNKGTGKSQTEIMKEQLLPPLQESLNNVKNRQSSSRICAGFFTDEILTAYTKDQGFKQGNPQPTLLP